MKDKKYNLFNKKTILITGGTGSFGSMFVTNVLKKSKPKLIIIYSRDEMKQWKMQEKFKVYNNLKFIIGDVRDSKKLDEVFNNQKLDFVVHAAANSSYSWLNPEECIKTNIYGAINVIHIT